MSVKRQEDGIPIREAQPTTCEHLQYKSLRSRDGWAVCAAIIFIVLWALPLVPELIKLNIMFFQFDVTSTTQSPPGSTIDGDPFYWQYILTYRSLCHVFIVYDGKDLETSLQRCTAMNIGYTANISNAWIRDDPSATNSSDWDYGKTLSHVETRTSAAIYMIGFIFGLSGIITTIARMFNKWHVMTADAALKLGSVVFLTASAALLQVTGTPSQLFLGIVWATIIIMFYMLLVSLFDLWRHYSHCTLTTVHRQTAL